MQKNKIPQNGTLAHFMFAYEALYNLLNSTKFELAQYFESQPLTETSFPEEFTKDLEKLYDFVFYTCLIPFDGFMFPELVELAHEPPSDSAMLFGLFIVFLCCFCCCCK